MLLYTIKAKPAWEENRDRWNDKFNNTPPYVDRTKCQWGKIQYSLWVEEVKKKFKEGDKVTFANCPPMPNTLPYHYVIHMIWEIHHTVEYDYGINEPKAISVKKMDGFYESRCPSTLRHLTKEEIELVNLSNQKSQGTA